MERTIFLRSPAYSKSGTELLLKEEEVLEIHPGRVCSGFLPLKTFAIDFV
jgi:hypothetical protein